MGSIGISLKKPILNQKDDFESRLCDQTQWLYIVETFYMSQMNPKEFVHNTAYIGGHSL